MPNTIPWNVSLHGGHSSAYCDHADDPLADLVEAAYQQGFTTYGLTEHAPRIEEAFIYDEEKALGWTLETIWDNFVRYAEEVSALQAQYAGRMAILKGFEIEVMPRDRYPALMNQWREAFGFEYIVGSVHYVGTHHIDYTQDRFDRAAEEFGGVEALSVRYYETLAEMAEALQPEVIGHFDVIRKLAPDEASVSTPKIRDAACAALDSVQACGAILDLNTGGYRKQLGRPYPAPWIVAAARDRGIPFCFGDDSHAIDHVGSHFDDARQYLLDHGITSITGLKNDDDILTKEAISLLP